ncbi:MAG: hypothetical protein ACPG8W_14625 [Candidatus Promineifilaceae bacterium]
MKYASSTECEAIVGSYSVVFPATAEGTQNAFEVYSERGLDVSAFTNQATKAGGTFLFPVTDNASEVGGIMVEALDAIYLGQAPAADILPAANDAVKVAGSLRYNSPNFLMQPHTFSQGRVAVVRGGWGRG